MLGLERSKSIEDPRFDGNPPTVAIIVSRYFNDLGDALVAQARERLKRDFVDTEVISMPGVLELPAALRIAAESGRFDGFVILGGIHAGENGEDAIYHEVLRSLLALSGEGMAVGTGLLWADNRKKLSKMGAKRSNYGGAAATAALHLIAAHRGMTPISTGENETFRPDEEHIIVAEAEPTSTETTEAEDEPPFERKEPTFS